MLRHIQNLHQLIMKAIKETQKIHPEIKFHLYSGNAQDVTEKLDKGLLDFGILIEPTNFSKYDFNAIIKKAVN